MPAVSSVVAHLSRSLDETLYSAGERGFRMRYRKTCDCAILAELHAVPTYWCRHHAPTPAVRRFIHHRGGSHDKEQVAGFGSNPGHCTARGPGADGGNS